jgi:hypothetical protein
MKTKSILALAMIVLSFFSPLSAEAVVHFNDGQTHNIDYEIGQVEVDYESPGVQTRVNLLDGGSIGGDHLEAWEDSLIYLYGGVITGELVSNGRSHIYIYGGYVRDDTFVRHYAHMEVFGGRIGDGAHEDYLIAEDNSSVNIYGWDFALDGQPVDYGELVSSGVLTGILSSSELINTRVYITQNAKITLVPEPTTLLLLALGAVILRGKH